LNRFDSVGQEQLHVNNLVVFKDCLIEKQFEQTYKGRFNEWLSVVTDTQTRVVQDLSRNCWLDVVSLKSKQLLQWVVQHLNFEIALEVVSEAVGQSGVWRGAVNDQSVILGFVEGNELGV
jgi:hypothetical protein